MKKVAIWCAFFACLLLFLTPFCRAETGEEDGAIDTEAAAIGAEWTAFRDAIPPEVAELLPDAFFSQEMADAAGGIQEATAPQTVLSVVGRLTGLAIGENLALLARICGILVLSAVARAIGNGKEGGLSAVLSFCTTAAMVICLFTLQRVRFSDISTYFKSMQGLCVAVLPLMGALYAMGGNVGAAVANHGMMSAFLTILETMLSGTVLPVAGLCLALGLLDAVSGKVDLRSLSTLIKRTYTVCFSFLMLLLCGVLGIQSTLAKGSDTLALRTVRFAAGSFLPVVGGSVSEALRTVAGSVSYLRSVTGAGAMVVLFFTFLPMFLSVLLNRIAFLLGGAVAKLLGCGGEEKVLSELASVYGYFLSVIASLFVTVVFSLTLFAHCGAAGGAL